MKRSLLFTLFLYCSTVVPAQQLMTNATLYVIDSLPLFNNLEDWNTITDDDIADSHTITNKDSISMLNLGQFTNVAYIFTKAYRIRPDSIKRIPTTKLMKVKNGLLHLNDTPYSGKYIDYFINGKRLSEGELLNGKRNGTAIIYFRNGKRKSVLNYKEDVLHGPRQDFYKNGRLSQTSDYENGGFTNQKTYFANGQIQQEMRPKLGTNYDTIVEYYSTGQIKKIKLGKNGKFHLDDKSYKIGYYTTYFHQSLRDKNLREANNFFYKLWKLDSSSIETHFKEGALLYNEKKFDKAIASFNRALEIEPMMREALTYRAISRITKYKNPKEVSAGDNHIFTLKLEDFALLPPEEQLKVCNDLVLADEIDQTDYFLLQRLPAEILRLCIKN